MSDMPLEGLDTTVPHPARMHNYVLGGKDHFPADREAAEKRLAVLPDWRTSARENRWFLGRAVTYLTKEAGLRQFLDIGPGLPAAGATHEVAQAIAPETRVRSRAACSSPTASRPASSARSSASGSTRIASRCSSCSAKPAAGPRARRCICRVPSTYLRTFH